MSLQFLSILLEAVVAVLFILAAQKNKSYLYGLALTFGIYVYYDLSRLLAWTVSDSLLSILFFVATVSALWSAWGIYKKW
jgi:hypothetical protein